MKNRYQPREILSQIDGRVSVEGTLKRFGFMYYKNELVPTLLIVDVVILFDNHWKKVDHVWIRLNKDLLQKCTHLTERSRIRFTAKKELYTDFHLDSANIKYGFRRIRDLNTLQNGRGKSLHAHLSSATHARIASFIAI
jgi:hypothetical protein